MTVCVAALCDRGTVVVGAADRMLTSGDIEFEPPQTKVMNLTSSISALVAGDASFQAEILFKVQAEVAARVQASPTVWLTVEEVSQMYVRDYNSARFKRAENAVLAPLGMDGTSFVNNQQRMSPQLVDKLAAEIINFSVSDAAVIFAGVDNDGAHIYTVQNGVVSCNDVVGFSAIGAGAWHADSQLMFAAHTKWRVFGETLLLTYSAKKRSEVAPGVGAATDMFVIGPTLCSYTAIGDHVLQKPGKDLQGRRNKATKGAAKIPRANK